MNIRADRPTAASTSPRRTTASRPTTWSATKKKHNEANGEGNRDGDNNNFSDNYGVEGPTRRPEIEEIRLRQIKNMMATLLLSQGVPMIVAGDECRRTQQGNNNAYCQDNELSWFDWKLVEKNSDLLRFCQGLIAFRKQQPSVRRETFLSGHPQAHDDGSLPDVSWFGPLGTAVDWDEGQSALICLLTRPKPDADPEGIGRDVLFLINSTGEPKDFILPPATKGTQWRLFVDTAATTPKDIYPDLDGAAPPTSHRLTLTYRSMMVYVAAE